MKMNYLCASSETLIVNMKMNGPERKENGQERARIEEGKRKLRRQKGKKINVEPKRARTR